MNVRQFYTFIEFFGYVLQIMPVLFLFFVPYEQKFLKISRKSLSVFLAVFTFAISLGTSCFLGSQYGKIDDNLLMLLGNLIFLRFSVGGHRNIFFLCQKKRWVQAPYIYAGTAVCRLYLFRRGDRDKVYSCSVVLLWLSSLLGDWRDDLSGRYRAYIPAGISFPSVFWKSEISEGWKKEYPVDFRVFNL